MTPASTYGKRLGELIRTKRRIKGLTQLQLAEDAFNSPNKVRRISDLENGIVGNPHPKTIDPIISVLEISEAELAECLQGSGIPDPDLDRAYREARNLIDALAYQFEHSSPDASLRDLDEYLRGKASEWRNLRARLDGLDAEDAHIEDEKGRVAEALADGQMEKVDTILAALEQRYQQQQTLKEVAKLAEIRVARADACLMNEDLNGALRHYLHAASFFEPFSQADVVRLLEESAYRVYETGLRTFKPRFSIAIKMLEKVLEYDFVALDPFRRAQADYQLSLICRNAAVRDSSSELFERALDHARNAEAYALKAGNSYQIVMTKISVANCLLNTSQYATTSEKIEQAKSTLQSAKVIASEEAGAAPLLGYICNNLGSVILDESRSKGNKPSIEVIAAALSQFTSAVDSAEKHYNVTVWGDAKINRGRALARQAELHEPGSPQQIFLFIQSVSEHLAAIETFPETSFPDRLAEANISVADVLAELARIIQDTRMEVYMLRAIHSLEVASAIYETYATPRWAECQMRIGSIIARHGQSAFANNPKYDFEEAIRRFEVAHDAFVKSSDNERATVCLKAVDRARAEIELLTGK